MCLIQRTFGRVTSCLKQRDTTLLSWPLRHGIRQAIDQPWPCRVMSVSWVRHEYVLINDINPTNLIMHIFLDISDKISPTSVIEKQSVMRFNRRHNAFDSSRIQRISWMEVIPYLWNSTIWIDNEQHINYERLPYISPHSAMCYPGQ